MTQKVNYLWSTFIKGSKEQFGPWGNQLITCEHSAKTKTLSSLTVQLTEVVNKDPYLLLIKWSLSYLIPSPKQEAM